MGIVNMRKCITVDDTKIIGLGTEVTEGFYLAKWECENCSEYANVQVKKGITKIEARKAIVCPNCGCSGTLR